MHMQKNTPKPKRLMAAVLALVLTLGLIPSLPAQAETPADNMPSSIILKNADYGGFGEKAYNSPNGLGRCYLHRFTMDVTGTDSYGFCYDHSKKLNTTYQGMSWTYSTKINAGASNVYPFLPFLDWWIYAMEVTAKIDAQHPELPESEKRKLDQDYLSKFEQTWTNAWVQSSVWLARTRQFTDCHDPEQIKMVAKERDAVLEAFKVDVDYTDWTSERMLNLYVKLWDEGSIAHRDYYLYWPPGDGIQPVLVPELPHDSPPDTGNEEGYIKVLKVDGDDKPLNGAEFTVYRDSQKTDVAGTIVTDSTGWGYTKVEFDFEKTQQTFWVLETKAPSGKYTIDPKPYEVTVDSVKNATAATAALARGGLGIVNIISPPTPLPPPGLVTKVDAETGAGVGPATFNFKGQTDKGSMVDADYTCDANGSLDLQWSDPTADKYIAPGQYTVTEKVPPPGYEKTDMVLELTYDQPVATSSGPLVFENDKKHTVIIEKVGPNERRLF